MYSIAWSHYYFKNKMHICRQRDEERKLEIEWDRDEQIQETGRNVISILKWGKFWRWTGVHRERPSLVPLYHTKQVLKTKVVSFISFLFFYN